MALTVERIANEPILIATITGHVSVDVIKEMFAESAKLADEMAVPTIWRVTDVTDIEATFTDLVLILGEAAKTAPPGSPADPRFHGSLVGSHQLVQMYSKAIKQKQYGQLNIPVFSDMDTALASIRAQIAERANKPESSAAA